MKRFIRWLADIFYPNPYDLVPEAKKHEILPGVDKPSLVLATMLAGKMLANPDYTVKKEDGSPKRRGLPDPMRWGWTETATFRGDGYLIEFVSQYGSHYCSGISRRVKVILPVCSFDGQELRLLENTFEKVKELHAKRIAAEAETARQEKAVKAIADFFVTEENP